MIPHFAINPGMQVRNPHTFPGMSAQGEVDRVAFGDLSLVNATRDGSLNRAEFLALSAQQNDLARLAGQLAGDGWLDEQERARLSARRDSFYANLDEYRRNDCQPTGGPQDDISSFLYDSITSGRLSQQQAFFLRMNQSAFNFATGSTSPYDTPL